MESGADLEVVELLLHSYPAGANEADGKGRLPLHVAVEAGAKVGTLPLLASSPPPVLPTTPLAPCSSLRHTFLVLERRDCLGSPRASSSLEGSRRAPSCVGRTNAVD